MRKPKIAVCLLTLAMALWAARPVALADGIDWLTEDVPEAGETAPEPQERSSARLIDDEDPGLEWLTPDSGASGGNSEERPDPEDAEEEIGKYTPKSTAAMKLPALAQPAASKSAAVVGAAAVSEETEWLTMDESPAVKEEPTAYTPEEDTVWLTQDQPSEPEEAEETEEAAPDTGALIKVTVPLSGQMVINPHRLPVDLGGREVRDQIINPPQQLTNHSDVPVIVTASVTVNNDEGDGLTVTDRPIGEGETDKLAYLYVEFQNVSDSDEEAAWSGGYTGASNQILVSGSGTVSKDVLRVEAGDKIPSYASYRLFGSLTENPEAGWQAGDKLSVTVSFTFRPAEEAEPEEESETEEEPVEVDAEPVEADAEPVEADVKPADPEPVEATAEPEELPEMKDKAAAKPEEIREAVPEAKPEPDPEPEPEGEAEEVTAYEPPAVSERYEEPEPPKPVSEGLDSFAAGSNPAWFAPPDTNGVES